ncbi:rna-directed dna polymerase from mobile element jockey-like [Limosa lapponica baueri]|uniref:Rna-directed dna polymerase from mobile element jockey-like n=1 Tax=Limosa lapponica baueri TaxID=1758121 RepID=A0A2I0U9W4_LIMLA|nr:rna-directed dna polymerase from mobile element jockey-like [Limosa lapponica baueri]
MVIMSGMESNWIPATSDVHQGLVLAPIAFNILFDHLDNGPEKLADRNIMNFNKGKCKVLHLGRSKSMHQYTLRASWLEGSLVENGLMILVVNKLTTSEQCAHMTKAATSILGCTRKSFTSKLREAVFPLCSVPMRHIWSAGSRSGVPSVRKK